MRIVSAAAEVAVVAPVKMRDRSPRVSQRRSAMVVMFRLEDRNARTNRSVRAFDPDAYVRGARSVDLVSSFDG
jgi:hypothetical protein